MAVLCVTLGGTGRKDSPTSDLLLRVVSALLRGALTLYGTLCTTEREEEGTDQAVETATVDGDESGDCLERPYHCRNDLNLI